MQKPNHSFPQLDATLFGRPNNLMELHLEPHRQCIGDNTVRKFLAAEWRLARRNPLQGSVLLFGGQGMDPRDQKMAQAVQVAAADGFPSPLIIFLCANHELDLVPSL